MTELKFKTDETASSTKKHWRTYTDKKTIVGEMLPDNGQLLTIDHLEVKELQNQKGKESKPCLFFKGTDLFLVMNVTNLKKAAEVLGSKFPVDWKSKQITLVPEEGFFFGKKQMAVRLR